ncbi:MAG: hypothetical protein H6667_24120 [Ardenticatenaceae bacterium]|nr:hypothetical protein [Ardenticatenaceae bacterium]
MVDEYFTCSSPTATIILKQRHQQNLHSLLPLILIVTGSLALTGLWVRS